MYRRFGKRLLDLAISIPALILLAPVLASTALLVRFKLGPPILFQQERPGLNGRPFTMLKFRTLTNARDAKGGFLPDDQRLNPTGTLLRRTSLDELPELLNVIKGEMSLVGPRPLLVEYLDHYGPEHARRHEVTPGITGWAQVNGRQRINFSKRLDFDVWYVDHLSFGLDLTIMALTIVGVLARDGVISDQDVREVDDIGLSSGAHAEVQRK